jgi:hypothetical protein
VPRLSLYRPNKTNDYRFFDRNISEQLTTGGTDLYIHKYLGPTNQGPSIDYTQPEYDSLNPNNIQDLLFLENRDRTYDTSIYRLRGQYNVQNLDFDLSQFGLFLNNDIIFIAVHYNDMIDIMGRKLMVGDVLELPHLLDYNPLKETIPTALKRFYQITDANYASEGFSQTWFPHLWRIKCEPLVDSQEFKEILDLPAEEGSTNTLRDVLSTYEKEMQINAAVVAQAEADTAKSGYNTKHLYTLQVDDQGKPELVTTDINNLDASTANVMADRINQTPDKLGYQGYLLGDGFAPNGEVFGHGTGFPQGSEKGNYFLRTDFLPNRLFRYDGSRWIKMEDAVRMTLTNTNNRNTQKTGFINNTNTTTVAGETIDQRQSLSQALKPKADN